MLSAAAIMGMGSAAGQHYFGIRAGVGSGSYRVFPQEETGSVWGLYSAGASWKFYTAEKFVGGIEIDAQWMQQGFKLYHMQLDIETEQRERIGYYQRTVDVVMVPIMWQPHVYMFRQRVRVFLNAGVTFSYVLSSQEKEVSYVSDTETGGKYELKPTRDNRLGYGLVGGGGISWSVGRLELFAEARYYIGYSDILKNRNKYEDNPLRSPLDGLQFQVGAYWRIGKGGIRSEQGRRVTDAMIRNIALPEDEHTTVETEESIGDAETSVGTVIEEETVATEAADEESSAKEKTKKETRRERRRGSDT